MIDRDLSRLLFAVAVLLPILGANVHTHHANI
jgi:hypothetical protein